MLYHAVLLLSQLPKDAISLLRKMLELNPEKRITAIDALFVSVNPLPTCLHAIHCLNQGRGSSSQLRPLWELAQVLQIVQQ